MRRLELADTLVWSLAVALWAGFAVPARSSAAKAKEVERLAAECRAGSEKSCQRLEQIARREGDDRVRAAAVRPLTDQVILADLATGDFPEDVRAAAARNFRDEKKLAAIAVKDASSFVCSAAVKAIGDQALLASLVPSLPHSLCRTDALNKVTDRKLFAAVFGELLSAFVSQGQYYSQLEAGLERLDEDSLLARVAMLESAACAVESPPDDCSWQGHLRSRAAESLDGLAPVEKGSDPKLGPQVGLTVTALLLPETLGSYPAKEHVVLREAVYSLCAEILAGAGITVVDPGTADILHLRVTGLFEPLSGTYSGGGNRYAGARALTIVSVDRAGDTFWRRRFSARTELPERVRPESYLQRSRAPFYESLRASGLVSALLDLAFGPKDDPLRGARLMALAARERSAGTGFRHERELAGCFEDEWGHCQPAADAVTDAAIDEIATDSGKLEHVALNAATDYAREQAIARVGNVLFLQQMAERDPNPYFRGVAQRRLQALPAVPP